MATPVLGGELGHPLGCFWLQVVGVTGGPSLEQRQGGPLWPLAVGPAVRSSPLTGGLARQALAWPLDGLLRCSGVNGSPRKRYAHILLEPVKVTFFGRSVFADGIKLRILRLDHAGLSRWTLNTMTSVFIRDRRETQTQRSHVKVEAGIEVMQPQAQGRLEPTKLEETGRVLP